MSPTFASESVVVSLGSFESEDPSALIESNIAFLNALFGEYVAHDEVAPEALHSYYVDYYLAQVENGGFSQFVYNTGWDAFIVGHVRAGLQAMGASGHIELFERGAAIVDRFDAAALQAYFESGYFGDNEERDVLDDTNAAFCALNERENLTTVNARWLRSLPSLYVMTDTEMAQELRLRAAAMPDRDERIATARAAEPRWLQLIRALCTEAGQEFSRVTGGDPAHVHEGEPITAWHFITDRGHHYMLDLDDQALMFDGDSHARVAQIPTPAGP